MKPYYEKDGVLIYHADCFQILHDLEGIGGVFTDPPYSSGGAFRSDRTQSTVTKYVNSDTQVVRPEFSGDNRDSRSFLAWCSLWLAGARAASVAGAPIATFIDWRQVPIMTDALQAGGWTWLNMGTWWKPGIRMQKGRMSSSAEYLIYGGNGPVNEGKKAIQNVFSCKPDSDKEHIAQKPLEVCNWGLCLFPEGATILDPFMGSGRVLEAARSAGHPCVGIDIDEASCELAARRLEQGVLFGPTKEKPKQNELL